MTEVTINEPDLDTGLSSLVASVWGLRTAWHEKMCWALAGTWKGTRTTEICELIEELAGKLEDKQLEWKED